MMPKPVIYIAGEGHNGLKRRWSAWEKHFGLSLQDAPLFVSSAPVAFLDSQAAAVVTAKVREVANKHGNPALIIVDTLARNFGDGDENSTKDMNAFVAAIDDLRRDFGATALIVHHSGHSDKNRGRGAMSLKGALDAEFKVSKTGDLMAITATKMKDAPLPDPIIRKFISVDLGRSKSGEEISSSVLVPTHDKPLKKQIKLTENELLGLRAYEQAVRDNADAFCGKGQMLDADLWRKHFDLNTTLSNPDSRRKAFQRVRDSLLEKQCITQPKEGFYQLAGSYLELEQILQLECCGTAGQDGTSADTVRGN